METIKSVIHIFNHTNQVSPFDINMAVDAGFDHVIPYDNVQVEEVYGLTQDVIFSRGPKGAKRTGIFIGGRDIAIALQMLQIIKDAMVPPFEVSVLADPSGAFTTAATIVALVEKQLMAKHGLALKDCRAIVFGGTGPVGLATGIIASSAGADVTIADHASIDRAMELAGKYSRICGCCLKGTEASSEADKAWWVKRVDVIFCTAKAGVQILNRELVEEAERLKVAADVNAVPPPGIEGIEPKHDGHPLKHATKSPGAVGIGPLTIGNVKYKLQNALLRDLRMEEGPFYYDIFQVFERARRLVRELEEKRRAKGGPGVPS